MRLGEVDISIPNISEAKSIEDSKVDVSQEADIGDMSKDTLPTAGSHKVRLVEGQDNLTDLLLAECSSE